MKTPCPLTDAVVELTLEAPASSEVAAHHKARCVACRDAAELARAALEVWRADAPTSAEITGARARIQARTRPTVITHRPVWLIAVAVLMAGGAATAALAPPWSHLASRRSEPVPEVAPTRGETSPARVVARASSKATDPTPAASVESDPEPSPEPRDEAPVSKDHPRALSEASSVPVARAEIAPTARPDSPPAEAPSSAPSNVDPIAPAPAGTSDAWSRAAAAMRRGDSKAAEAALGELEAANDATTRDAARLAHAELQIASGHHDDARATLADLAAHGATPLVRKRAVELLNAAP